MVPVFKNAEKRFTAKKRFTSQLVIIRLVDELEKSGLRSAADLLTVVSVRIVRILVRSGATRVETLRSI